MHGYTRKPDDGGETIINFDLDTGWCAKQVVSIEGEGGRDVSVLVYVPEKRNVILYYVGLSFIESIFLAYLFVSIALSMTVRRTFQYFLPGPISPMNRLRFQQSYTLHFKQPAFSGLSCLLNSFLLKIILCANPNYCWFVTWFLYWRRIRSWWNYGSFPP